MFPVQIVFPMFLLINRETLTNLIPSQRCIYNTEQLIYCIGHIIWCIWRSNFDRSVNPYWNSLLNIFKNFRRRQIWNLWLNRVRNSLRLIIRSSQCWRFRCSPICFGSTTSTEFRIATNQGSVGVLQVSQDRPLISNNRIQNVLLLIFSFFWTKQHFESKKPWFFIPRPTT